MRQIIILSALISLLLPGCLKVPVHQGNRLDSNTIHSIHEGDSKYSIEQRIGSPALDNSLHPHRVTYYEEFEDEDSGDMLKRGVEITYDRALRATHIRIFGFTQ